jgi:hypothetical protein
MPYLILTHICVNTVDKAIVLIGSRPLGTYAIGNM